MHIRLPIFLFEQMPLDDLDRLIADAGSRIFSPTCGDLAGEFLSTAYAIREAMLIMDADIRQQVEASATIIDDTSTQTFRARCEEIARDAQSRYLQRIIRWL